jgi:hypothetical protein
LVSGDDFMKCAYLFNADNFKYDYGTPINEFVFKTLLANRQLKISTKIFVGDLLLYNYSCDEETIENGVRQTFNSDKFSSLVASMLCPEKPIWRTIGRAGIQILNNHNIYAVCLESVDFSVADYLDYELKKQDYYIGALEIYDAAPTHWLLFTHSLIPKFRMMDKRVKLFCDGIDFEEDLDYGTLTRLKELGFQSADFEPLNGRYTIFDKYDNFEQAGRVAEWKSKGNDMLAFIADDVVSKLSDAAPDIGDRLWSIVNTFESAETNEQHAQACVSCRRLLEYIADSIFPPSDNTVNGHDVSKNKYKNRLMAFADEARKSDTNIDVICVSADMLNEQIEKIINLQNKGVHDEVFRHESRRCIIRTIMLLYDIISLKADSFEIKPELDFSDFFNQGSF